MRSSPRGLRVKNFDPRVKPMKNNSFAVRALRGVILLSVFALTGSMNGLTTSTEVPRLDPHKGDLESAQKEALERNAPLIIHILLEGGEHSGEYRDAILGDNELIKASSACVVIVANNGEHTQTTITEKVKGKSRKRTACSVYKMCENCEHHRKAFNALYNEYQEESGDLICPQVIICTPKGKVSFNDKSREAQQASSIIKGIKTALKEAGKGLSADELLIVKGHNVAATNAAKSENWPVTWKRSQVILELIDVGKWAEQARSAQANSLAKMRAQLAALKERFVPGQVAAAWRELIALTEATKDTPFAREVMVSKKKIERDKTLKDDISAIKTEMEAESIWNEADGLLRRGEERKATKLLKKLLEKKFTGTETQARVRERFPELG